MTWVIGAFLCLLVACAVGVIASRHPIYSAVFLLILFLALAGIYILLKAEFLAVAVVLAYGGGILVLYLFALMLTHGDTLRFQRIFHWQKWWALALVGLLFGWGGHKLAHTDWAAIRWAPSPTRAVVHKEEGVSWLKERADRKKLMAQNEPKAVSQTLFRDHLVAFETLSVLLLAALVGAVYLARGDREGENG